MAIGNHGSVSAKFDAVISRLTCIMPTGSTNHLGSASGSSANGGSMLSGSNTVQQWKDDMESTVSPDGNCSTPSVADKAASTSSTAAHSVAAAAAGAWCSIVKGGSCGSSGDVLQRHIEVRGNHRDRIRSVGLAQPSEGTSAAPGVWWATSDKLETYSNVTQSITSFAAPPLQAAGSINVITLDKAGNVWLGTTKGSVTVRQRTTWEQVSPVALSVFLSQNPQTPGVTFADDAQQCIALPLWHWQAGQNCSLTCRAYHVAHFAAAPSTPVCSLCHLLLCSCQVILLLAAVSGAWQRMLTVMQFGVAMKTARSLSSRSTTAG